MTSGRHKQIQQLYRRELARNQLAEPGPHAFVVVLDHLKASFNVPKIFRSADAFGAHAVYLVGVPPFDPSPAVGSFRKVPVKVFEEMEPALAELHQQGHTLVALDPGAKELLHDAELPKKSALLFGHEEFGFSFDLRSYRDVRLVRIPQFGQVESLNVSVAASIAMYEYTRQWSNRS